MTDMDLSEDVLQESLSRICSSKDNIANERQAILDAIRSAHDGFSGNRYEKTLEFNESYAHTLEDAEKALLESSNFIQRLQGHLQKYLSLKYE